MPKDLSEGLKELRETLDQLEPHEIYLFLGFAQGMKAKRAIETA